MAWRRYQEIELRTPNSFPVLIFDVDTLPQDYLSIAFGVTVRPPNWIVSNPETGHAHIVYCFARPVLHGDGMRQKPSCGGSASPSITAWSMGRIVATRAS